MNRHQLNVLEKICGLVDMLPGALPPDVLQEIEDGRGGALYERWVLTEEIDRQGVIRDFIDYWRSNDFDGGFLENFEAVDSAYCDHIGGGDDLYEMAA